MKGWDYVDCKHAVKLQLLSIRTHIFDSLMFPELYILIYILNSMRWQQNDLVTSVFRNTNDIGTMENSTQKKLKLDSLGLVPESRMRDHLSALPDKILCHTLSFVSIRDSIRTRVLSSRWRYLSDYRPLLLLDASDMLGLKHTFGLSYQLNAKFVRAVDQFLQRWNISNLRALQINFCLDNNQASHIDRWVQTFIMMQIPDLELIFSSSTELDEIYVLSDQLFHPANAFRLKCLRLSNCSLTFSSWCPTWINCLTTLELIYVGLNEKEIQCVLSGGLNLTSLTMVECCDPHSNSINVALPRLEKLFLDDSLTNVELNCPKLETLECAGLIRNFIFSHVPVLSNVSLDLYCHPMGCALTFNNLARHAPKLQDLSLCVMLAVQQLSGNNTMSCLKRLDLNTQVPAGFDLLTITYLLNASPSLETLCVRLHLRDCISRYPKREYADFPLLKLKQVKIVGFQYAWNEMELAQYLLKNALALQRMIIVHQGHDSTTLREEIATTLLRDIKTTAELVIRGANGVYQG